MKNELVFLQISSLEKVFLDEDFSRFREIQTVDAAKGERVSYQILYTDTEEREVVHWHAEADSRIRVTARMVGSVGCARTTWNRGGDQFYLRTAPGLYPDVLYDMKEDRFMVIPGLCHSLFITCHIPEDMEAGEYPVTITFTCGEEKVTKVMTLNVMDVVLEKADENYFTIFHADSLEAYYKFPMYSEEHWAMIEKYIRMAADTGVDSLFVPAFSNPNDTEPDKYRPDFQLVEVTLKDGEYSYDFSKLTRWFDICRKAGINRFSTAPFFSQWGSGKTPQIFVNTENGRERIFGWHTDAFSEEYVAFLNSFLPAYVAYLKERGIYENMGFSCSDEPSEDDMGMYQRQMGILTAHVSKDKFVEALADTSFVHKGIVKEPNPITRELDRFVEENIQVNYTYYCCHPVNDGFSNRLIAMPGGRTRILGAQMYSYGIRGFGHWGFNFYYSQLSRKVINPYLVTDADEGFPAGDPFVIYPGEDGPLESLRSVQFYEAIQDYRACKVLEKYIGREAVKAIIEEDGCIRMNRYPRTNEGVLAIRERINKALKEALACGKK